MKNYIDKVKKCLNNECGGPNLENMMGIGTSMAAFCAVQKLGGAICDTVKSTLVSACELWNG